MKNELEINIVNTNLDRKEYIPPLIDILADNFRYSDIGSGAYGYQSDKEVEKINKEIIDICSIISTKILELHKLINGK